METMKGLFPFPFSSTLLVILKKYKGQPQYVTWDWANAEINFISMGSLQGDNQCFGFVSVWIIFILASRIRIRIQVAK